MSSRTSPFCRMIPLPKGLFFICLVLFITYGNAHAQCDNVMNPPMFAAARACKFYSLTLTLGGPGVQGTESVTWSVTLQNPPVPMGTLADIGLSMTPLGTTCTISGTPTITGNFDLQVTASCNAGSPNCFVCGAGSDCSACSNAITRSLTISVTTARQPVDVMMVLDISGSMLQPIPGYPASLNKWGVLKESVKAFLEDYKNWGECDDRIGVTYFDDNRLNFRTGGLLFFNKAPDGPIPLTGPTSIAADLDSKSPGATTCLGGGILAGYNAFDGMHPHRNLIVFTDGIQNMEPTVSQAAGTDMVINDYNIRGDGTGFPAPPLDLKAPALPFRTYAVGIGDNAVTSLLTAITQAPSNNDYDGQVFPINSTVDLASTLSTAFTQSFVESLAQFSPQLVDIRRISISGAASTKFTVNPSADKLLIRIVANPGMLKEARIRIDKDGRDLSSLLRPGGETYRSFFVDTTTIKRYEVALGGEWRVSITGPQGTYQITCMVNDEELEALGNLGHKEYAPGDTIPLMVTLGYKDQPVKNASRATVWVAKPGQDANDLFASAASVDLPGNFPGEKGNDPGQAKYEALLALNPAFAEALQPVNDSIPLTNEGNGNYTGGFSDTRESGIYTFVFRLAGNDSLTGAYERFILRSTVVDFGPADNSKSTFQIIVRDGISYFLIIPKNKFDHLLGPNRLNQVQLLVDGKALALKDNLDGSYEAAVPDFPFFNPDPRVKVSIKGDTFFNDSYSDIKDSNLTVWDMYRLWIILLVLILIIILIFYFLRRN